MSPVAGSNGIELWYEAFGDRDAAPLLLVTRLGGQAVEWDDGFCLQLAGRGFYVIRYDLRDAGLSTKLDNAPVPDIAAISAGDFSTVGYTLRELTADALGLLDALGVAKAHIAGASLGGMIAQQLAIVAPERVQSLTLISTSPSNDAVQQGSADARANLINDRRVSADRETAIDAWMESRRGQASPAFPFDEARMRAHLERMFDRSWYPVGRTRQLVAIFASPDRTDALGHLDVPAVVIHGDSDPVVDVSGGESLAKAISGSELIVISGMGHDLPEEVWPQVLDAMERVAR